MGVYKNENEKLVSYDTAQIMGTDHLGIGKVDGETITVSADGTLKVVDSIVNDITKVKATTITETLNTANWIGTKAPFSQIISISSVKADSYIELTVPSNITLEQIEAYQSACIASGTVNNGSITVNAYGEKPSINLPLLIIVRGC